ncbi:MAG: HTH domain-containing protein [Candidatus Omnitrophica bacterium]|nr:HTH domain-containing protein [Candidatus Omnitrophota bacterium]MDD5437046.1 HTH domain-containing protein [Candidatus Omnitrophota bacterium]
MHKEAKTREADVLALIVKRYVETAEPVGSRFIAKQLDLSSATIRNVMSDLEESGYITHPHTSAGRIPTDKGYRYYIESLMQVKNVNDSVAKSIQGEYTHARRSLEDVLERTSHLISNLTNYVGLTLFSEYHKLYLDGTSHIVEQPEFKDFRKLYCILRSLEEKRDILDLLADDVDTDRLTIHIGKENQSNYLSECSIVTRGYKVKGKVSGRLGVIGPKRMVYEKVIPTVEYLADAVTELLEELDV